MAVPPPPSSAGDPDAGDPDAGDPEMQRVVIYLDNTKPAALSPPAADPTVRVEQKGRAFFPEVVVIPIGGSVSFPNLDPIVHNVFSLSGPKTFDLGYYPKGQSRSVRFDKPGIASVYCRLHPHMSAAVVVAPGPWFARPNPAGEFLMNEVPPGSYTLVVWHKSAGAFRRKIRLEPGGSVSTSVEIPLREEQRTAHSHEIGHQ